MKPVSRTPTVIKSWPYWYGYLRLSLDIPVTEYPMRGDYSNEMEDFLHGLRG